MDWQFIIETFFLTLRGVPTTLAIMAVAFALSFLPALLLALARIHRVKGITGFSMVYLAFVRATPPILLILFFYSLLPSVLNVFMQRIGSSVNVFDFNPIFYAFIVFGFLTTASLSEVFRSALMTVNRGQLEAGQAIGLSNFQTYRRIIFPQALVSALPNLCNLMINLVKGTSLVFVMTVQDITAIARVQAAYGYHYFEAYFVIFVVYLLLCGAIQGVFSLLQHRNSQRTSKNVRKELSHAKRYSYSQKLSAAISFKRR
ncbi:MULTISPECIES: amino acid ABC transporter permease [Enterococcus]|uniref:amino acid ABC transporter permease n=1 Tax=Enterococcus TaxID=1350 RepID=UPI001A9BAA15|nr:amino acid ABC transporter permease [Enterococcus sp. 665A]MBO1338963.1 amino acid ABC transporter permease [Enterococcus sp. 665A]